jgi:AcrR family transcriptional regulator
MSTSKVGRETYHHGDLRDALLLAARDLLAESGTGGVSLREAARRAGVSHNAPYRHFDSREVLLAALSAQGFEELGRRLREAGIAAAKPDRLASLGRAYLRFAAEERPVFLLMFGGETRAAEHPDLHEAARGAFAVLRKTVAEHGGSEEATEAAALRAWGVVHGLSHLVATGHLSLERAEASLSG